jgi:glycogen operon protein
MLLAGDELGNSQQGNNNAYCQDNDISWLDWEGADAQMLEFTRTMIAFRKDHPILRQKRFLHSEERASDGKPDLFWWRSDGKPMTPRDWEDPALSHLAVEMRTASGTPDYDVLEAALFMVFNTGGPLQVRLPAVAPDKQWCRCIDTAQDMPMAEERESVRAMVSAASVAVFRLDAKA